ncbi:metallophosphoesterase, partial [Brevundimonas sp.]
MKQADVIGRVLAVSDMHSAYERTAQLLAAFETEVRSNPVPHVIAIDGDIFEHGNVVAVRSGGAVDWAFLRALPAIAPTVFNLGNHDNDL